jgi:hypothetical protein
MAERRRREERLSASEAEKAADFGTVAERNRRREMAKAGEGRMAAVRPTEELPKSVRVALKGDDGEKPLEGVCNRTVGGGGRQTNVRKPLQL